MFLWLSIIALLAAASQRLEFVLLEWFGNEWVQEILQEWQRRERGALPGLVESAIVIYIFGRNETIFSSFFRRKG